MKRIIDRFFPKKFKVKVQHFSEKYYTIQYSHSRFWDKWKRLMFYDIYQDDWNIGLYQVTEAEDIAKTLHSIQDVKEIHKKESDKRIAYRKDTIPYKEKRIK